MTQRFATYFFFLMIRRPPRSTLDRSSAASDVYKRQGHNGVREAVMGMAQRAPTAEELAKMKALVREGMELGLSLIHISEPTRPY